MGRDHHLVAIIRHYPHEPDTNFVCKPIRRDFRCLLRIYRLTIDTDNNAFYQQFNVGRYHAITK